LIPSSLTGEKKMNEVVYTKFRWFVLATLVVVMATTAMALISPAPLVGAIQKSMPDLSLGQVTYVTMFYFNFFVAFAALFGGILLDKFGVVKVFIGCLLLISLGALLVPYIGSSYYGLLFIRLLQGCGTGPVMASGAKIAASYFPSNERSVAAGAVGFAVAGGILLGLQFFPRIYVATGSWQTSLTWLAPIGIVGIIFSIILAFGPKPTEVEQPQIESPGKGELKAALLMPVTWVAIGSIVMLSWVFQAFMDLTPNYLGYAAPIGLGLGEVKAGNIMSVAEIFFMAGAMISGTITEKIFKGNGRPMLLTGFFMGGIFGFLIKFHFITGNDISLVSCLIVASFFFAFVNPQAIGYLAKHYPKHITGKLGGLGMGIGIFGGAAGVAAGARALHVTGLYQMSINIMVGVCVVGFLIGMFLTPKTERA
jgi:MFS family permease